MYLFASTVFLLLITPGPGVLSAAGFGAAYGNRAGMRYLVGLFIGANLVAVLVALGLAALILANPVVRTVFMVMSGLYLLYLAFRIAFAGRKIAFIEAKGKPGIFSGIILQVINPKAYAVNTTLFSGFAFMPEALLTETLIKFAIINSIWIPIHLLWLYAGTSLQRLDLAPHIQFRINMGMAAAMIGVVILAATSIF